MKAILSISIFTIIIISSIGQSFGQEQMQYFLNTFKSGDNCLISHVYSSKLYVPAQVKIYHDATPTFSVSTNSTTSGAQINPVGSDNNVYIENVINSTAQFSIQVYAKYADGKEHPFLIEFWSQNAPLSAEQYSTTNSQFCHTIMIDTALAPVLPDIGKEVQKITQSLLGQFVSIVSQNSVTLFYALVFMVIFCLIIVILIVLMAIKLGSFQDVNNAVYQKMASTLGILNKNIILFNSDRKMTLINNNKMTKKIESLQEKQEAISVSFFNELEIRFRSLFIEAMRTWENQKGIDQIQKETPKQKEIINEKIEEVPFKIPEEIEETKPSLREKIVDAVRKPTKIFGTKEPKITKSEQEWSEFWSKEKDDEKLTDRLNQILKEYEELPNNEQPDEEALNESNAIHKILMVRNNIES